MRTPPPVLVADRFPALLKTLLDLLASLAPADWLRPTVAANWSVHDVALHLLGGDIGILSSGRDDFIETHTPVETFAELVDWINERNDMYVKANRRTSPRLLCDLLRSTGEQVSAYFSSLDPDAIGGTVGWASPDPAPTWLVLGREFTERWHHQQHIREAVGREILSDPYFLAPVLATFIRALPQSYRDQEAPENTCVTLTVSGASGGSWSIVRERGRWQLYEGMPPRPQAQVTIPEDIAWRLFTKGMTKEAARDKITLSGDKSLGEQMLQVVSIIA